MLTSPNMRRILFRVPSSWLAAYSSCSRATHSSLRRSAARHSPSALSFASVTINWFSKSIAANDSCDSICCVKFLSDPTCCIEASNAAKSPERRASSTEAIRSDTMPGSPDAAVAICDAIGNLVVLSPVRGSTPLARFRPA